MLDRRSFLSSATALIGTAGITAAFRGDAIARVARASEGLDGDHGNGHGDAHGNAHLAPAAQDEDYWGQIQRCFDVDRTVINLNNGGVCPSPTHVLDQMIRDLKFSNESPVQHMWRVLEPRIESVRRDVAREFGCDPEEIAITRNASEAMENLIFGIDLKRGDEVVITDQNYPRMITSWDQRARREGIVVKKVSYPVPLTDPGILLQKIRDQITSKTRVIELPQVVNWTGQILPIADIVKIGKEKNIEVFVDGAHAFAHIPFTRDQLGCDYFGTSLHKWTLAPIGTGFLYVNKAKIKSIWPLMAADATQNDNIRKFEEIGTHPAANHNAITAALAFHRAIGSARKAARLRFLRDRWARPLLAAAPDRVKFWAPLDDRSCGLVMVKIEGVDNGKLFGHLWDKHRIVVSPTKHDQFEGIRVSPNVYTTLDEIDTFADVMKAAATKGLS